MTIQEKLAVPFPQELIRYRKVGDRTLSYVEPLEYRKRLLEAFPSGFKFETLNTRYIAPAEAFVCDAHFYGSEDGVVYDITVSAAEPIMKKGEGMQQQAETLAKLASAGLKAISREMGLGAALYERDDDEIAPQAAQTPGKAAKPAARTASSGEWDGSAEISFGQKYKGRTYASMTSKDELGWLSWASEKDKPDPGAVKELARRKAGKVASGATASTKPAVQEPEPAEDEEVSW